MKDKGFEMSASTYWRERGKISAETLSRIYEIAKEMTERHVERIDELEKIKQEMWNSYDLETEPRFKVRILKEIKELQPYLSAYDEAAKHILEDSMKKYGQESSIQQGISALS